MAKQTSAVASGKAAPVIALAEKHGWTHEVKQDHKNDITTLKFERENVKVNPGLVETVEIRWDGNSCKETPVVSFDGQLRYVRNVAAAKRVLEATQEQNGEPFQKRVAAKQGLRKAAPVKRAPSKTRKLPFTGESTDDEIKAAALGRKIVWLNSISGQFEEDVVLKDKNRNGHYYVSHTGEKRQLSFVGSYGFRSVKLDAIAAVR
ncbi:hypothetical protein GJ25_gp054 [Mycobacterium phage Hawkeye]|uniref:Uncharacterized protein n=1 Tax=Mycobacterium phage Hawkeye TaxID=1458711 RepID=X2KT29_9CAUD|nr:hypothetical protein GJ25_gp054 [Mycobacterium phage Hawkeye]AHN84065.1 hypothetical protein PBI_HAWKEYE_54 [Mycobacterium phage Hawkeye]